MKFKNSNPIYIIIKFLIFLLKNILKNNIKIIKNIYKQLNLF